MTIWNQACDVWCEGKSHIHTLHVLCSSLVTSYKHGRGAKPPRL